MERGRIVIERLIERLPEDVRPYGWIIVGLVALMLFLILFSVARRTFGLMFRRSRTLDLRLGPTEFLADYPVLSDSPADRRLTVEGVPVRLRLVILAPMGTQTSLDVASAEEWLDRVLWGLGSIAQQDRPRFRVWPGQLSRSGFIAGVARTVKRPEPEGEASRWILLAGQTPPRPQPILLGLALWADDPVHIGRMTLEPGQWASVLRIQPVTT